MNNINFAKPMALLRRAYIKMEDIKVGMYLIIFIYVAKFSHLRTSG